MVRRGGGKGLLWGTAVVLLLLGFVRPFVALRPLKERVSSAADSWGRWSFLDATNGSTRFLDFGKSSGVSVVELVSSPTRIHGGDRGRMVGKTLPLLLSFANGRNSAVMQKRTSSRCRIWCRCRCLRRLAAAVFAVVAVAWISISPLPYLVPLSLSSPPRYCCLRRCRCRLDYVADTRLSLRRRSLQLVAVTAVACRSR
ncbi:hypothetical protein GW17_00032904 [Ensete ventricosum]|nr:hypothetical protein GW17_00032904 [Ensete ventricosum]